jgi:hypothetical protein
VDDKNASPKIMRSTFHCVPRDKKALRKVTGNMGGSNSVGDLLGVLITPLCVPCKDDVPPSELNIELIPTLSSSAQERTINPIQCNQCGTKLSEPPEF